MPDNYGRQSHQELWTDLTMAQPHQVEQIASGWASIESTTNSLATTLTHDLAQLSLGWSSDAGQEFGRRVGLIAQFAGDLATQFGDVKQGLNLMAGPLREALAAAENPAETDDHDGLSGGAANGARIGAFAGPIGIVGGAAIGGFLGHQQDEEEKERARQRMVQLVSGLATDYDIAANRQWPNYPQQVPSDLPGGPISGYSGNEATVPTYVEGSDIVLGSGGQGGYHGVGGPTTLAGLPITGAGGPDGYSTIAAPNPSSVTGLAGAGSMIGVTGTGAGTVLGGAAALTATGLASAVHGAVKGGQSSSRSGNNGSSTGAAGGLGGDDADQRPAVLGGRSGGPGGSGTNNSAARPGAGGAGDDDTEDHTTWLTEDNMDWGGDEPAAPSVLGGSGPGGE